MQQQRSGVMQRRDCAPEQASSGKSVFETLGFEIRQARTRGGQAVSAQTRLVNWSSVPFAPAARLQQAMAAPGAPHPSVSSNGSARRAALFPH